MAQNRRHIYTRIQSLLLVVDFRFGSILCLLYQESVTTTHGYVTIHFLHRSSAVSLWHKNRSESVVLCVNESPFRYVFGAGTRAIPVYGVDSRKLRQNSHYHLQNKGVFIIYGEGWQMGKRNAWNLMYPPQ